METVFLSLSKSDFQDLIAETVNACFRRNYSPDKPVPDTYITRKEAANTLHITLPTLSTYTLDGKVNGYRIGRRVLYKKNEVEQAATAIAINKKGGIR